MAGAAVGGVDGTAEYVDPAVAAGGQPDEASDVWSLAAVCHHLLCGSAPHDGDSADSVLAAARSGERAPLGLLAPKAPRPLVAAIEQALQADPARRPTAAEFASAIRRAHAAAPVRLSGAESAAVPGADIRPTHVVRAAPAPTPDAAAVADGSRRRRVLIGAGALLLLSGAACIGWLSGRSGPVQLASVAAATPAASAPAKVSVVAVIPSWRSILGSLDSARADAFASGDPAALSAVYAPGSPLLAADRNAMARLVAAGQRARGVRHTIRSLGVTSHDDHSAVLRVVDELAAYEVVDASGRVVQHTALRSAAAFVVRIVNTRAGWRLAAVTPA
jgi:hypothetical protein